MICLQAGHQNARSNCDSNLRKSTGAPGEVEFTVRIRDRLSQILISKGFQLQLVDATFNCDPKSDDNDYQLFLAIHYDADIYRDKDGYSIPGGFVAVPDPSADFAHAESKRIQEALISEYFNHAGIENHPERANVNTKFYYMWKFLSAKTPCILIECGVGQNPHDKVILADTDRVCNAIARGICKAFNVPFDSPPTPAEPPIPPEPVPTPIPPVPNLLSELIASVKSVKAILWGKGFWWTKIRRLKELLPPN